MDLSFSFMDSYYMMQVVRLRNVVNMQLFRVSSVDYFSTPDTYLK
jgi:hypothetical protein